MPAVRPARRASGDGVADHLAGRVPGRRQALPRRSPFRPTELYLVAGDGGYGFRCQGRGFPVARQGRQGLPDPRRRRIAGHLPACSRPLAKSPASTRDGRALVFPIDEVRLLAKGRGLKLIDADPGQDGAGGDHPGRSKALPAS
ncbi:MAG: hypothetical protein MZW92_08130 [Comamonadaceae bacterium]|nr:hypothetical protein [Comamonadaceae bacterium]